MDSSLAAAIALHRQGRLDEAEAAYRRILAQNPHLAEAHNALGIALQQQGKPAEAAESFRRAVALKPDYAGAYGNLGAALKALGEAEQSLAALEQAMILAPDSAEAHYNMACALQESGQWEPAIGLYERAIALHPRHAGAHNNLGIVLKSQGRLDQALAAYAASLTAEDNPVVRYNHAQALLEAGEFQRGWAEHEWRFAAGIAQSRHAHLPRWTGEPLAGRNILVWAEQGNGDSIQFCRYLPLLTQAGAQVVFEVQPPLERLCRSLPGVTVVARGQPLPACHVQIPLMSLPAVMGSVAWSGPYLMPEQAEAARLADILGPRRRRRIGLVWAGSPTHKDDHNRSISAELLLSALTKADADLFSVQVGPSARSDLPGVTDLSPHLSDFASSAAALSHMELVITVDTAILHLAGALGLPVWGLIAFAPDWRWLHRGETSDWYPSLRLFRQHKPRDWVTVVERIRVQLEASW
jgi:Flp pilus assembly protein TadD